MEGFIYISETSIPRSDALDNPNHTSPRRDSFKAEISLKESQYNLNNKLTF